MRRAKNWLVGLLIVAGSYLGFLWIVSLQYPISFKEPNWGLTGAFIFLFLANLLYWKWWKLLKKFEWNDRKQKWEQVFEEHRK